MLFGKRRKFVKKKLGGRQIQIDLRVPKKEDFNQLEKAGISLNDILNLIYDVFQERNELVPDKKLVLSLNSKFNSSEGWYYTELCRPGIAIISMGIKRLMNSDNKRWKKYLFHELTHHKDYSLLLSDLKENCYDENGLNLDKLKVTKRYRNIFYVRFLELLDVLARTKGEGVAQLSEVVYDDKIVFRQDTINGASSLFWKLDNNKPISTKTFYTAGFSLIFFLSLYLAQKNKKEDLISFEKCLSYGSKNKKKIKSMDDFFDYYKVAHFTNAFKEYGTIYKITFNLGSGFKSFCLKEILPLATKTNFFDFLKLMDNVCEKFEIDFNPLSYKFYLKKKEEIWKDYLEHCEKEGIEKPLKKQELFHIEKWHEAMISSSV